MELGEEHADIRHLIVKPPRDKRRAVLEPSEREIPMKGFQPTLFDRLADEAPYRTGESAPLRRWSFEELKRSVAVDLEALLNSRSGPAEDLLARYPQSARSLAAFGMVDFVGLSLSNPADRARICATLERAIRNHEPRLQNVNVGLRFDSRTVGRLNFVIQAVLDVPPASEPVGFDAVLHPTTQQYSVASSRRAKESEFA